ncbi:MAG TPA: hypothetical protein VMF08_03225 [Candidatus Sulfotelmatobacter sp.]|nr:hypothetical protein [Candidatus Sulfotelmatobacter sp.]
MHLLYWRRRKKSEQSVPQNYEQAHKQPLFESQGREGADEGIEKLVAQQIAENTSEGLHQK